MFKEPARSAEPNVLKHPVEMCIQRQEPHISVNWLLLVFTPDDDLSTYVLQTFAGFTLGIHV